ncbi:MAG: sensor domain-containing diguanylate cyclase [Halioglobus sp.]|nr:sensor domain-containing diguanylate cyclase [Halioglobus sp.]
MQAPRFPLNEWARLQALRSKLILDTPHEARFDRLTRIASKLFDVPIALVSLVDEDRQWFKSAVGLDAPETPRDISFCGHAILEDSVFVVEDAIEDARFADNPLVAGEPFIRFYAGCPLKTSEQLNIGTLCLIDTLPRAFSQADCESLRDLAGMVEREIELTGLATSDELTGIPNRRGFMMLGEKTLKICRRKNLPASMAYFDIDSFKQINDTHGHGEGDRALSLVADSLRSTLRDSDVFGRLGGDEFVVLFSDANAETARRVIERFEGKLHALCRQQALAYDIDLSCGVVQYDPSLHACIDAMLEEGDRLMYADKNAGRADPVDPPPGVAPCRGAA